ncbi:hypothetical protein [Anaplasma capra]|uniref:hypothetical protein n=1 Tax=Anaplasma capra TaxID=1562740 RepID=UPI0021D5BF90|nr:hypothetical protein [Anaplasma capra]MCU7611890.1 hypothetical protein [Anaplasma capra]MCU7612265.1 hypothetical protein [Anaplasma capra]
MAVARGGQEQNMGPNLAAVQSLLDATRDMSGGGEQEGDDKSALAIASAVMATPTEALKSDVVANLLGNVDRAVVSLGANITPQVSIFSPTKGTSVFFGFPILFDSIAHGGSADEGGDMSSGGEEGGALEGEGDGGQHMDARDESYLYDPWHFNQYPYANEEIAHASRGMEGVSHEESGMLLHHDMEPSMSPGMHHEHSEGRGI